MASSLATLSFAAACAPMQLGSAADMFSSGAVSGVSAAPTPQPQRRRPGVEVVNSVSSPGETTWLIRHCSVLKPLQSGVRSTTSYSCKSGLGVASISEVFSKIGAGGGKGFGGGGRGGGGGGGDGFEVPAAVEGSLGITSGGEAANFVTEDVIFLSVGGMSCGGCSASVKRILEAQPQVKEATVDLVTETATVQITSEPVAASGWEVVKRQLGESLAKHLSSCGFNSSLKEDGDKVAPAV